MFLYPFFLIAAAVGAAVPLILHLMQTRKRAKIPFPTLRFLRLAQKQSSRRIRIENLILWLLRTLIMVALGMAFATPILRSRGLSWLGDAPRDVALVLDASYSMGYDTGRDTIWNKALDAARTVIEGLGENDRFCIYLAREQPEALVVAPISDKEEGLNRLKSLQPGQGTSRLAPAVTAAMKALNKEGGGRERELHIVTDNQAVPWESFGSASAGEDAARWNPDVLGEGTGLFVTMLGVSSPQNTGPADIDLQPAIVRPGSPAEVSVSLLGAGLSRDSTATLFIEDEERGRRSIGAGSPDSAAPVFALPPLPLGIHAARIETPRDNLPIDDAFYFLIEVEEQRPSLCVGNPDDTLFVRTALQAAAGKEGTPPAVIPPAQLADESLIRYSCVFLCNALPLSGQEISALEDYARAGGLLVIFPGLAASAGDYAAWNCLPGVPTEIVQLPLVMRRRTLTFDQPRHVLVRPLLQSDSVPPLGVHRALIWETLHAEAVPLISMGAGRPFLLERPFGGGRILMFAVAADRTWSDFPLSPFYLPLLVRCLDYSTGLGAKAPYHWATDSLPLTGLLDEVPRGSSLIGPDQKAVPVRSTVEEGRTRYVAEELAAPGIYRLREPAQLKPTTALAINLPRHESDLTVVPADSLAERLGVEGLYLAGDAQSLQRLVEEHRVGRSFGEHLLWLALLLIAVEFVYANFLLRSGPKLSERLEVAASGQVKGHAT